MAEEIIIGKLIVDTSDLNASMADSKKAIIDLENEQKKLKKDTEGLTYANEDQLNSFVANELELKKLKAEYAANQKSVLDLTKAQTGLDNALKANITTQEQAKKNTQELTAARRLIDSTTLDGAKAIAEINTKIDSNNKLIRDNSSAQEKAATISGNYRQALFGVDAALSQFGINGEQARNVVKGFGEGITGAAQGFTDFTAKATAGARAQLGFKTSSQLATEQQAAQTIATEAQAVASEAQAVATTQAAVATNVGTLSLRGFAVALAATGIGVVVLAIAALVSYLSALDPVMDKIEQITSGVAAAFSSLGKALANLDFSNLIGGMEDAATAAVALTKARQDLADLQSSQEVANARESQQYDELILKSKNRTLTEKQRSAFLQQAQKIEEQNFKQREALSNAELRNAIEAARIKGELSKQELANLNKNTIAYATYLLNAGKITQKEYDGIKAAELGKIAIQNESTKRLEKNQNAQDKLADDAAAKNDKRQADAKAASEKALAKELKDAQNRIEILKLEAQQRNLSTEERIANAQKVFNLENDLAQRSLSGSEQTKKLIENRQTLSSTILSITEEQINKELEAQKVANEKSKATMQEQFDAQRQSAEDLAKAQLMLLNGKLLSEKAFADETVKIEEAKNEAILLIDTNAAAAKKLADEAAIVEAKALQDLAFQIRLQDIADRDAAEQEIKQALLQEQYAQELILLEQSLANKALSQGVYDQKLKLAEKKFNSETVKNDKILNKQKRDETERTVANGLNALGSLFEGSKAIAVASALFNTYQGITAELSTKAVTPYEIGLKVANVAFVAAAGFAAVKNILKTNKGDSSVGDTSTAKPVTTSGTGSFVNTAQTETVARVSDTPQQSNVVVTPPVLILETLQEATNNLAIKVASN